MSAHARRRSLVTSALVEVRARDVLARLALARLAHLDRAAGQLQAWRRLLIAHSPSTAATAARAARAGSDCGGPGGRAGSGVWPATGHPVDGVGPGMLTPGPVRRLPPRIPIDERGVTRCQQLRLPHLPHPGRGRTATPQLRAHTGGQAANPAAGRRPPDLPERGTRVVLVGRDRHGEVMPYDRRFSHGGFPVRFDDGQWRRMLASDLILEQGGSR